MHSPLLLIIFCVFLAFLPVTDGFTLAQCQNCIHLTHSVDVQRLRLKGSNSERYFRSTTRRTSTISQDEGFENEEAKIIQIFSFDGAIADTSKWRSRLAVDVAMKTWPHLQKLLAELKGSSNVSHDDIAKDQPWLINKMCALSHVVYSSTDGMMGCEAVLLARLLIEEQSLDLGRSSGCKGKYGSKYHPSTSKQSGNTKNYNGNDSNGSRPLTVGEIAANWCDGGCLRDTLRAKYNIDFKDPFPTIKENLYERVNNGQNNKQLPDLHPMIQELMSEQQSKIITIVLLGHSIFTPLAAAAFSKMSVPSHNMNSVKNLLNSKESGVYLISPGEGGQGHRGILQDILLQTKPHTSIQVIHSTVEVLEGAKFFFGDNRPRYENNGYGTSAFGHNVKLKLSLPTWSDDVVHSQMNQVEMDPWLTLAHKSDVRDVLSLIVED